MREQSVKIIQALTSPILLAGVPRQFAILNGTFCTAFVFALHQIWIVLLSLSLHVIALVLTKKDPYFFAVIVRQLKQKSYFDV